MTAIDWFNNARFGMFIHWGPYSVAGRGEWVRNREMIPQDEYIRKYVNNFKAEKFNPSEWAKLAKATGMKYVVLTTRHHDGFALWDTRTTDFNSVKMGPKRDVVKEYAEAVRAKGLKVGFYYSVADISHPDYPGPYYRDWPAKWEDEEARKRFVKFYKKQLEELMTNYGKVDMLWYDGCIPMPMGGREVNTMVKQLQPDILINERNGNPSDFKICEKAFEPPKDNTPWEMCETLNDNWGYCIGDDECKSPRQIINLLLMAAMRGGNLLFNIGPRPDGAVEPKQVEILRAVGKWLERNGEFLPNSSRSPFSWGNSTKLTTRGNTIYAHNFYQIPDEICVAGVRNRVRAVYLVATKAPLTYRQEESRIFIPRQSGLVQDKLVTTIAIEVEGKPEPIFPFDVFGIPCQCD